MAGRRPVQFGGVPSHIRLTAAQRAKAQVDAQPVATPQATVPQAQAGMQAIQQAVQAQQVAADSGFPIFKVGLYSLGAYLLLTKVIIPWAERD